MGSIQLSLNDFPKAWHMGQISRILVEMRLSGKNTENFQAALDDQNREMVRDLFWAQGQ